MDKRFILGIGCLHCTGPAPAWRPLDRGSAAPDAAGGALTAAILLPVHNRRLSNWHSGAVQDHRMAKAMCWSLQLQAINCCTHSSLKADIAASSTQTTCLR